MKGVYKIQIGLMRFVGVSNGRPNWKSIGLPMVVEAEFGSAEAASRFGNEIGLAASDHFPKDSRGQKSAHPAVVFVGPNGETWADGDLPESLASAGTYTEVSQ